MGSAINSLKAPLVKLWRKATLVLDLGHARML